VQKEATQCVAQTRRYPRYLSRPDFYFVENFGGGGGGDDAGLTGCVDRSQLADDDDDVDPAMADAAAVGDAGGEGEEAADAAQQTGEAVRFEIAELAQSTLDEMVSACECACECARKL
jgi:hypothetical protein